LFRPAGAEAPPRAFYYSGSCPNDAGSAVYLSALKSKPNKRLPGKTLKIPVGGWVANQKEFL
jgi:hypothetical protein